MKKNKKLIIVGTTEFACITYEYFTEDSEYEVVAFAVEAEFKEVDELNGLAVVEYEKLVDLYPPDSYEVFVALTYRGLNRPRKRIFEDCKQKGYRCASYISSKSFCWKNVKIGENSFVFEDNTLQYNVKIGNNTILWSGNHVGHSSCIGDNIWITSHVVISGFCQIGSGSFIGVNATIGDEVKIAEDTVLGAGAVTVKDINEKGQVYVGNPAKKLADRTAYSQFGVEE